VFSVHATVAVTAADSNGFLELGLTENVVQALRDVGYEAPTPIQAATIPVILAGSDVLGQAQTGTGKTGAFALPILSKIDVTKPQTQAMVLVPTRELAIQVAEAFQRYATHMKGFHVLPIYGGQSYTPQLKGLKRGAHVIVGTPGRVMDHMKRGTLPLDAMSFLVLDEADEMLQMGFIDAIEWILEQSPPTRQIALFSATVPPAIRRIAQRHQRSPKEITIRSKTSTAPNIRQRYWLVSGMHKLDALTRILEVETFDAMLVFVRTKLETVELAERLEARGFEAAPLNGDIPQAQRERTIAALKSGKVDIVVATDVAARGLDVERISHVVNYDVPYDSESYIHRIGRTGRAGRSGEAILFIAPRERNMLRIIERATRQQITQMNLPSVAAVNEQRVARFKQRIADTLADGETEAFRAIVEEFQAEHDVSALDVAAALASLVQGSTPLLLPERSEAEQSRGWGRRDDQRDGPPRDRDRGTAPGRGRYGESRGQRGGRGDRAEVVRSDRGEGYGARADRGGRTDNSGERAPNRDNESRRRGRDERPAEQAAPADRGEGYGARAEPGDRGEGRGDRGVGNDSRDDRRGANDAQGDRDTRPTGERQYGDGAGHSRNRGREDHRPVEQPSASPNFGDAKVDGEPVGGFGDAKVGGEVVSGFGDAEIGAEVVSGEHDAFTLERDVHDTVDGPVQFADVGHAGDEAHGVRAADASGDEQADAAQSVHAADASRAVAANGAAQGDASAPRGDEHGNRLRKFADDRGGASDGHNARSNRGPRDRGARGGQSDAGPQAAPGARLNGGKRDDNADVVFETFRLEVGHTHGVKPGNIVGAIANEAGLEGRHIGHVDIRDDHTFVDLPEGMPRDIFRNLKKVRVVGQELRISRVDGKPPRQH
jgi:ATP-dependent RNA helicase DeaD